MSNSKIKEGDSVPAFKLQDQNGNWFDSESLKGQAYVLYFYPKDDTPGCTAQACSFRDAIEDFKGIGVQVIGISSDSPESHKAFAERHRLPFTLLSDKGNKLRKSFGVPGGFFGLVPGRVTYVVDKNGVVQKIFNSQLQVTKHVSEALEVFA